MSYHTPDRKSEAAFEKYIQTVKGYELGGIAIIVRGFGEEITGSTLTIVASKAGPFPKENPAGNWNLIVTLKLMSPFVKNSAGLEVPGATHDEWLGLITDLLMPTIDPALGETTVGEALARQLNTVMAGEDMHFDYAIIGERDNRVEGKKFVSEQQVEVEMSPARPA